MFEPNERQYLEAARVGRFATVDADGVPSVVPICYAVTDDAVVSAVDEKPQSVDATDLRRSRDIRANPRVALVVDHYTEQWASLGWVQVRGTATHCHPTDPGHASGVTALREKYGQYTDHDLESRPLIRVTPAAVRSWGDLDPASVT